MFPQCPADKFLPHHWRSDTVELGRLEANWVAAQFSGVNDTGAFHMDWPVQVNRILRDGLPAKGKNIPFSLIISIGQVVPHEIAGMANHAKNIFVGTGGKEAIDKSHWLGALYGLEHLMGTTENPVRSLFDEALRRYGKILPPILWVLTVVDYSDNVRGLFCGFGRDCFESAAALAAELSIERIAPIKKAVVWLDGGEYRSTWLGNKAIYRTRRAMADGGELLILAPGLDCFGEDPGLDALIRRYGYRGTAAVRRAVAEPEIGILTAKSTTAKKARLADNLSAAAHLIHGSSEGRFTIRYCTSTAEPRGLLGRKDIESVGYEWGNLEEAAARYVPAGPDCIKPGWNKTADGETYYFIRNPGLGLWVSE
jgi:nickel-dependent lactate racemase